MNTFEKIILKRKRYKSDDSIWFTETFCNNLNMILELDTDDEVKKEAMKSIVRDEGADVVDIVRYIIRFEDKSTRNYILQMFFSQKELEQVENDIENGHEQVMIPPKKKQLKISENIQVQKNQSEPKSDFFVVVKSLDGKEKKIQLNKDDTIYTLKQKVATIYEENITDFDLSFKAQKLEFNDKKIDFYGIEKSGSIIKKFIHTT